MILSREDAKARGLPDTFVIDEMSGCWNWTGATSGTGYAHFGWHTLAHRAYLEAHTGEPAGRVVMHICDNRRCVNPAHLKSGTHRENSRDMTLKARHSNQCQKLSIGTVTEIKALLEAGFTGTCISEAYGVSISTVSKINVGKHWSYVSTSEDDYE